MQTVEFLKVYQSNMKEMGVSLTRNETRIALDAFVASVKNATDMDEDGKTYIAGFGKFEKKFRPAHVGRNPRTGDSVNVADKTTIKFKVSKTLAE